MYFRIKRSDALRQTLTPRERGITLRSVVTGSVLVTLLCAVTPYTDLVIVTTMLSSSQISIGCFGILLLLVAVVNPLLRLTRIVRPFRRVELLIIFCMLSVAAGLASFGLADHLFSMTAGLKYRMWARRYHWDTALVPHIPHQLIPQDEKAITQLFDGMPEGKSIYPSWFPLVPRARRSASPWGDVPWRAWWPPLLWWSVFLVAFYFGFISLCRLLFRQWARAEMLSFPLAQIPLVMTEGEDSGRTFNAFLHSRAAWIGLGIGFSIYLYKGLANYFPALPNFDMYADIESHFSGSAFQGIHSCRVEYSLAFLGLAFLLPLEISFSLFFFYWIGRSQWVISSWIGYNPRYAPIKGDWIINNGLLTAQGAGALFVLGVLSFWKARHYLAAVLRSARDEWLAWRHDPAAKARQAEDDDPQSYLGIVTSLVLCWLVMFVWLVSVGLSVWITLVYLGLVLLVTVAVMRLVCEAGIFTVQCYATPFHYLNTFLGSRRIGVANLAILAPIYSLTMLDMKTYMPPAAMNGSQLVDKARSLTRGVGLVMLLAVILGIASSCISTLLCAYHVGGNRLSGWFFREVLPYTYKYIVQLVEFPTPQASDALIAYPGKAWAMSAGAAVTLITLFLRKGIMWWPHPIGLLAFIAPHPHNRIWFPALMGWMSKGLVLKFGGRQAHDKARQLCVGMILGHFLAAIIFVVVDCIYGVGHRMGIN